MSIVKDKLLNSVNELQDCIDETRQTVIEMYGDDNELAIRLDSYDEGVEKIFDEIDKIENLNSRLDCEELSNISKKIVALSNMIKLDAIDLLFSIGTGINRYPEEDVWN